MKAGQIYGYRVHGPSEPAKGMRFDAAKMNLAQQAWEQNGVGRVRQLLEETAAYPERGFEWYYWQRQTHLEAVTPRGHLAGLGHLQRPRRRGMS